jgi:hypothetical protein
MLCETWALVRQCRLSVFLVGPENTTRAFLDALRAHLHQPVAEVHSRGPLVLPDAGRTGTLLLKDIGALHADDQQRLAEWLAHSARRTQVISTSSAPVLPMILAGEFAERLYYRLNTFYVDLTSVSPRDVTAMDVCRLSERKRPALAEGCRDGSTRNEVQKRSIR